MDLYRCESPECDFVTANPDLEQCPVCGGAFFVPATEEEVAPHGWFYLSQEAARAHRETDAYEASARGAVLGDAACQCEQGRRLHEGRGVARDQAAAAACFEAAAAQNSAAARSAASQRAAAANNAQTGSILVSSVCALSTAR